MAHTVRDKSSLLKRVRRIQGQLRSLEAQLDAESDCVAVLQQAAAVRGAINGLMAAIVEGHMNEHIVREANEKRRGREADIVLQVIRSYLK